MTFLTFQKAFYKLVKLFHTSFKPFMIKVTVSALKHKVSHVARASLSLNINLKNFSRHFMNTSRAFLSASLNWFLRCRPCQHGMEPYLCLYYGMIVTCHDHVITS